MHEIIRIKKNTLLRIVNYFLLPLFYLALAIIFSYPLILNFDSKIPNGYLQYKNPIVWGDHLQTYSKAIEHRYNLEHFLDTLYHKEFCFSKDINECKINLIEKTFGVVFSPYWPITLFSYIAPQIAAYNLNILFSFVTTGLASFWLARHFIILLIKSKDKYINIAGYLIALFSSLFCVLAHKRMIYLFAGQKIGYLLFLGILLILFIEKFLNKASIKNGVIISVLLITLNLTEQFLLFYGLWYLGLRIFWYEAVERRLIILRKLNFKSILKYLWIPVLISGLYLLSSLSKLGEINSSVVSSGRELDVIYFNSALISNLWTQKYTGFETNIYLGFGIIILLSALFQGIFVLISKRKIPISIFFILFILVMLVISLGLNTDMYKFLYDYFPTFKFSRTPTKSFFYIFPLITILTSIIISKVLLSLVNKYTRSRKYIIGLLIAMIFFNIYTTYSRIQISLVKIPVNPVYSIPENSKVMFLPLNRPIDPFGAIYEYFVINSKFLSVNGYTPFPKAEQEEFVEEYAADFNIGDISKDILLGLKDGYGIEYIVVSKKYFNASRIPVPKLEGLENDLNVTLDALERSNVEKFEENDEWVVYRI
ncbi:hypothetical protein KBD45_02015 [Candidatus Dojkabacteria bacterium]|nr:hypothetical protein [Candidatus Dojkabacteria bacterium]